MMTICKEVPGHKIANIVEGGITPNLSMRELSDIGYKMAVYPLTVMSSAMKAMIKSLDLLMKDEERSDLLIDFNFFSGPKPYAFTSAPTVGSK